MGAFTLFNFVSLIYIIGFLYACLVGVEEVFIQHDIGNQTPSLSQATSICSEEVAFAQTGSDSAFAKATEQDLCCSPGDYHSRDFNFLRTIVATMATSNRPPWKCSVCKQLRKHSAMYCNTCHQPWQNVIDHSFVHGQKQPQQQEQTHQYQTPWQGQQDWQAHWNSTSARGRTPSPRQRQRPRSAKGNKTPKNTQQAMTQPTPPMTMPAMPNPYMGPVPQMPMMYSQQPMMFPMQGAYLPCRHRMFLGNHRPQHRTWPKCQRLCLHLWVCHRQRLCQRCQHQPCRRCRREQLPSMAEDRRGGEGTYVYDERQTSRTARRHAEEGAKVLTKYGQQASTDLHAAVTALDTARNNYDEAVLAGVNIMRCGRNSSPMQFNYGKPMRLNLWIKNENSKNK